MADLFQPYGSCVHLTGAKSYQKTLAEGYGGLKPSIDQTYKSTVILP